MIRMPKPDCMRSALACLSAFAMTACAGNTDPSVPVGAPAYTVLDEANAAGGAPTRAGLQPGDRIDIRVYGEPELSVEDAQIDGEGRVAIPLVGDVAAVGLTPAQLGEAIEAAYRNGVLKRPDVFVSLKTTRTATVAVEGEVQLPGVHPFEAGDTLLTALARAQSPTETAALDEIVIFRMQDGQRVAGRFDLRDIRAGRRDDVPLRAGDTIVVGYSSLRGAFQDALRAIPVIGVFRPL